MNKSFMYFMANKNNTVIYVGSTTQITKRVFQHKAKAFKGFTAKYNCGKLVYFEQYDTISEAIIRERQIKAGNRKKKEELINTINPQWKDLSDGWILG